MKLKKKILISGIVIIILITGLFLSDALAGPSLWSTDSLNKGLVGYWPLDGEHFNSTTNQVDDISGYGNHGANSGAVLNTGVKGESEGALDFSTGSVSFNNPINQANLEQEWSVSAWVNIENTGDTQRLVSGMNSGLNLVHGATDKLLLYLNSGDNDYYVYSDSANLLTGQGWKHVVFLFRNSDGYRRIYIDAQDHTGSGPNKTYTPSGLASTFQVGGGVSGSIADLKIYNRVLSEDEITLLYESYKPKLSTTSLNKGLVGYWPLKPNSNTTPRTCKAILDKGLSYGDGIYTIDPDGPGENDSFQVYCDMTTDGGGWTLVTNIVDTAADNIPNTVSGVRSGWTEVSEGNLSSFNRVNSYNLSYYIGNNNLESFDPLNIKICAIKTKSDKRCYWSNLTASDFTYDGYGGGTGISNTNNLVKMAAALSGTVEYGGTINGAHGKFVTDDLALFKGDSYSGGGYIQQWSGDTANWHVWGYGVTQTNNYTNDREIYNNGSSDSGQLREYTEGWEVWLRESDENTLQDTKDNTPNTNHGIIHGADIRNHGIYMQGDILPGYIYIGGFPQLGTGDWTVAAWYKLESNTDYHHIFTANSQYDFAFKISKDPKIYFYSSETGSIMADDILSLNTWYFFVAQREGNDIKIWIDGQLKATGDGTGLNVDVTDFHIGKFNSEYSHGYQSDNLIYDRALSPSEILDLYNGKEVSGAILDMPLSQKTGVKDISGNGNHGINNNASIIGEAAYFDGVNDYIDLESLVSIDLGSASVSFWRQTNDTDQWLLLKGQSTSYYFMASHGTDSFYHNNCGSPTIYKDGELASAPSVDNSWHHYVATGVDFSSWTNFELSNYPNYHVHDYISDLQIYNHILSESEVKSLYSKGKAGSSVAISTGSLNKGLILDMPLTSKYTKDETTGSEIMADTTPYSNDGQNYGASIGENSTSFATTGEYIRILDDSILRPYNNEITFSLWLNPTAWATSENILTNGVVRIYHRGDWAGDRIYFLYRKDEYDSTGNSAWAYYAGVSTLNQLETDSWYHVVGVRDGDNLKIFLNGEKERDLDALENQTPYTSYSVVDIGKYNGQVSDVKIYDRALSAEEVKLLYDKGR